MGEEKANVREDDAVPVLEYRAGADEERGPTFGDVLLGLFCVFGGIVLGVIGLILVVAAFMFLLPVGLWSVVSLCGGGFFLWGMAMAFRVAEKAFHAWKPDRND